LVSLAAWRWKQYFPLKHLNSQTILHIIITHIVYDSSVLWCTLYLFLI
jgi:hypothetical protein